MLKKLNRLDLNGRLTQLTENIISNKPQKRTLLTVLVVLMAAAAILIFISNNDTIYKKTIARITAITEKHTTATNGITGSVEDLTEQDITAVIMNGRHKGETVKFPNKSSYSGAYDYALNVKDEVFLSLDEGNGEKITAARFLDVKRDTYMGYIVLMFILLMLLIGRKTGIRSLVSVIINFLIFSVIIALFLKGWNLTAVASIVGVLFIIVSISLVSGINRKTISAVIGTVAGTLISMIIAAAAIHFTHSDGIHYESMEFLTHPPEQIFFVEIMIGTLGAIMDIAISISSSLKEIHDKNPEIDMKGLVKSGQEIGKDIMGTMSNTLVFAYISGSIPMILLMIKNGVSISYIVNIDMSLEIIRALTGSIGIVISIPITIFITIMFLKNSKMGEI
ncbi:MAG: YibE/F family protein [Bacillota bacterium]|nr:YibE/F family protein [Bacillota bacterium]